MENELISLTTHFGIPPLEVAARLALSMVLGGLIGIDREIHNKAAGLRTHILIALASATFTVLTFELFTALRHEGDNAQLDASRVIQAVTAGVAFLAAGAIIRSRRGVRGLTTGASMWMAGSVGVGCGSGLYVVALIGTGLAMLALTILGWIEHRLTRRRRRNNDDNDDGDGDDWHGRPPRD